MLRVCLGHFQIADLAHIGWTEDPLQYLVIGSEERTMLLSVLSPPRIEYEFDDFIPGKGELAYLVILYVDILRVAVNKKP